MGHSRRRGACKQRISPGGMLHVRESARAAARSARYHSSLSHYYFPANNRAATMSTWCFMRGDNSLRARSKKGIKTNLQIRQPQMLIICRRYKGVNKLMTKRQLPALMASVCVIYFSCLCGACLQNTALFCDSDR